MYGYIYMIRNPKGKIYIGQTIHLKDRKSAYKTLKYPGQRLIYASIKKYGWESHKFIVIFRTKNISELDSYEIELIKSYNSCRRFSHRGLNLETGGRSGSRGSIHIETRKPFYIYDALNGKFLEKVECRSCWEHMEASDVTKAIKSKKVVKGRLYFDRYRGKSIQPVTSIKRIKKLIYQYNIHTGTFISSYKSPTEAVNLYNINRSGIISCCYRRYNITSAGGYYWSYDGKLLPSQVIEICKTSYQVTRKTP